MEAKEKYKKREKAKDDRRDALEERYLSLEVLVKELIVQVKEMKGGKVKEEVKGDIVKEEVKRDILTDEVKGDALKERHSKKVSFSSSPDNGTEC